MIHDAVSVNSHSLPLYTVFHTHTHDERILNFVTGNYDVLRNQQCASSFRHHYYTDEILHSICIHFKNTLVFV